MVYIDTKNFDIFNDIIDSRISSSLFEVDEFIAPIISLLNKKGYLTRFCCSGHIDNVYMENNVSYPACIGLQNDNCYITFEKKSFLKISSFPEGFEIERDTIRKTYKDYNSLNYFDRYLLIMNTMQDLYSWANDL